MIDKKFDVKFKEYHQRNPHVYDVFCKYALKAAKAGVKSTSGWLIINRMRWQSLVEEVVTDEYKLPNDYIGIYTRAFAKRYPKYDSLFSYKTTKRDLESLAQWVEGKEVKEQYDLFGH
jgi:hypothetical protein